MKTILLPLAACCALLLSAPLAAGAVEEEKNMGEAAQASSPAVEKVISLDGTEIAFVKRGSGPTLILVGGALSTRQGAEQFATLLAEDFTVINFDRRGRGDSGDTPPYSIEREVEDIRALIERAGGKASLFGASSGAGLALEAATRLGSNLVDKLILFEPPYIVDDTREPIRADFVDDVNALLADGKRSEVVELFMTEGVEVPAEAVAEMKQGPMWKGMTALAHTLPYDFAIVGRWQRGEPLPEDNWASANMPVLVLRGSASPAWMLNSNAAVADVLPDAELVTLEGLDHGAVFMAPDKVAAAVTEFFDD